MSVPNTFAAATSAIPLANLDADFAYYDAAFQIVGTAMEVNYTFRLEDPIDTTKKAEFVMSGITTGTTRLYTMPNASGTLATLANTSQTFLGTTTIAPTTNSGTVTIGAIPQTGTLTFGRSTATQAIDIAVGATTAVSTKTINIGTNGVSGSTTNINLGSAVSGAVNNIVLNNSAAADGVVYLNSFKVLTTGTGLRFDGATLGVGVYPSGWDTGSNKALQVAKSGAIYSNVSSNSISMSANLIVGTDSVYLYSDFASDYTQVSGKHIWSTAASGTAGNIISFTQAMTLDASGNLGIGTTSTTGKLNVAGNVAVSDGSWFGFGDAEERIRGDNQGWMQFFTGGTEQMRLTSTGLGIGTTSPATALSFPIGTNKYVGQTRVTPHLAGNVGSIGFGVDDGGGQTGVFVHNTHSGTYSSQDIRFVTAEGGTSVATVRAIIDKTGNLGLGVTPSAWSGVKAFEIVAGGALAGAGGALGISANTYFNGSNYIYKTNGNANLNLVNNSGGFSWHVAPSGTAGNAITFTQAMTLNASGNLLVGTTSSTASVGQTAKLQVAGGVRATSGFTSSINVGTIAQNATASITIPYNGLWVITNGANNTALILITLSGGATGVQLVFSTGTDIVCGGTSEPAGGTYLRIWMSASGGTLQVKNVNAYTGPYYMTPLATTGN